MIKKIKFLMILFTLTIPKGLTQVYHPIPTDSVYWVEYESGLNAGSSNCGYKTYRYIYPAGNVTINGNVYKEFMYNSIISYFSIFPWDPMIVCFPQQIFYNVHYAFIRNDSLARKVYLLRDTSDIMIYDFDVAIGDTIQLISGSNLYNYVAQCSDTFIVQKIDSIDLGGEYRRRIGIPRNNFFGDTLFIIEGMGNDFGFAKNIYCPFEHNTSLVCYHNKNLSYYPSNYSPSSCITNLGVESHLPLTQNFIYKNSQSTYFVKNLDNNSIQITCYDILGKFVLEKSFQESGYLDFTEVPAGIYFMYILYNGQSVRPYKFIVQH